MMLDASLRIFLIAALAGSTLAVMRVRACGVRHAVWTLVLAAMLLMPVLPSMVPAIGVPLPGDVATRIDSPGGPDVVPAAFAPSDQVDVRSRVSAPAAAAAVSGVGTEAGVQRQSRWSWRRVISIVYVTGLLLLLARLCVGWRRVAQLAREATPVRIAGDISIRESVHVATPVTAGIVAPVILLPAGWDDWPEEKLRACLAHERAHIRRRDPLVAFLARLNRCVYWFHPVAWWLERALAASAEDAADEAAVREIGHRRRYAEVLLDIAEAVRRRGGRVAWQGIGVDGTGLLGRRVDRVLRADGVATSRLRAVGAVTLCVASILLVVACRQPRHAPPLAPDPEVAKQLEQQKADRAMYERAKNMTAAGVDALEATLKKTPEDLEALKQLRAFYQASGQKVFGWDEMVRRRRPHILWLIENRPDHELAMWRVSPQGDAVTYAEAKKRWLEQTARADASGSVLRNAASFLQEADPKISEELLVFAKDSRRLGMLYGIVIAGPRSPRDGSPLTPFDSDPYARDVRERLMASADPVVLSEAGLWLARVYRDEKRRDLGRQLLERAVQIDPGQHRARDFLAAHRESIHGREAATALRMKAAALAGGSVAEKVRTGKELTEDEAARMEELQEQAMAQLPEADRFILLPGRADMDYSMAEYWDHVGKKDVAGRRWQRSKKYAQEALALAPRFRDHRDYGYVVYLANAAMAANVLREGHGQEAVRYMRAAAEAPAAEKLAVHTALITPQRIVNYLLKEGEREAVAEFLEKSGQLRTAEREPLLKAAAAIRAGRMPASYQYMVSR